MKGNILRIQQEENPLKTIIKGGFGLYASQSKNTFYKNLKYTKSLCHHVTNIRIPDKNVDNWEVLSFHATSTAGQTNALMVATTTGFLSNDHFKCTNTDPSAAGSSTNWITNTYDDSNWKNAIVIDPTKSNKLVHPHDIIGAAKWIWSAPNTGSAPSNEIWCRGKRGTEAVVWHGYQYFVQKIKVSVNSCIVVIGNHFFCF